MVNRKKQGGSVDFDEYKSVVVVDQFRPLLVALEKDNDIQALYSADEFDYDAASLAMLIANLIQFQENYLGVNAAVDSRTMTKIPHKLLLDYSIHGSVYVVLKTSLLFKKRQRWRSFDWTTPARRHTLLEMLKSIAKQLQSNQLWKLPIVYFASDISQTKAMNLRRIVEAHGGSVTNEQHAATHIIFQDPDEGKADDGVEYLRSIRRRDDASVLVHWWYKPDSYDSYVPTADVEGEPPVIPPHQGVWRVSSRWLLDLHKFNEWMNEVDYEDATYELPTTTTNQVEDDTTVLQARKRTKLNDFFESEQLMPESDVGGLSVYAPTLVLPSHCDWFQLNRVHERERSSLPEFFTGRSQLYTPAIYVEYRNFMINTYQQNPHLYLSATSCRRSLAGDVCAVLRVHRFLEHWGLINFAVQLDTALAVPTPMPLIAPLLTPAEQLTRVIDSQPSRTTPTPPTQTQPLQNGNAHAQTSTSSSHLDRTLQLSSHPIRAETITKSNNTKVEPSSSVESADNGSDPSIDNTVCCSVCKRDCTAVRYVARTRPRAISDNDDDDNTNASNETNQSAMKVDDIAVKQENVEQQNGHTTPIPNQLINLCVDCFAAGRFPKTMHSGDFTRDSRAQTDALQAARDGAGYWTHEETLRLVDALSLYSDDWTAVARHVGTKTPTQCALQLLRLPIDQSNESVKDDCASTLSNDAPLMRLASLLGEAADENAVRAATKAAHATLGNTVDSEQRAVQAAASTGVALVAQRAAKLRDANSLNLETQLLNLIEKKLDIVELKLSQFQQLEANLEDDRAALARERKTLLLKQMDLQRRELQLAQREAALNSSTNNTK